MAHIGFVWNMRKGISYHSIIHKLAGFVESRYCVVLVCSVHIPVIVMHCVLDKLSPILQVNLFPKAGVPVLSYAKRHHLAQAFTRVEEICNLGAARLTISLIITVK